MINLSLSGLPLFWDSEENCLHFGEALQEKDPDIRYLKDMVKVLYSKNGEAVEDPWRELYYMFRDLCLPRDKDLFDERRFRYDITVLLPGSVGEEYIKTAGHYHPEKEGTGVTYPEVYEVLNGRAHYIFQQPVELHDPQKGLDEIVAVEAGPGEKVVVPAGFGHVTVNPFPEPLIMSNLVADDFASVYEPIYSMGGAGYFELFSEEENTPVFVPNLNYSPLPRLKFCRAMDYTALSLSKEMPLYTAFIENPQGFSFLKEPEYYSAEFEDYIKNLILKESHVKVKQ